METKTVVKRTLWNGYQALQRLCRQKDDKGLSWPVRISHPLSQNLIKLRDDYEILDKARKGIAERLTANALDLAVKDGQGKPLPRGNGYVLKDPMAYRAEEKKEEDGWEVILKEPIEIHVIPIKASEIQAAMGESGFRVDGEDLAALTEFGVLVYDLDGAEKK